SESSESSSASTAASEISESSSASTAASESSESSSVSTAASESSESSSASTAASESSGSSSASTVASESSESSSASTAASESSQSSTVEYTSTTNSSSGEFECYAAGKFADPVNCREYHLCVKLGDEFVGMKGNCPEGTLYDSYNIYCTTLPVQCPGEPELKCTADGVWGHPYKCNRYYSCEYDYIFDRYHLKQYLCPPGETFSNDEQACVADTDCDEGWGGDFTCTEVGMFPVERNCSSFYECTWESEKFYQYTKHCGDDALYDRVKRKCRKACLVVNCPFNNIDLELE
ncbi:hypothetical protein GWI33_011502, partial [Rhynchophorus ferrugineus]